MLYQPNSYFTPYIVLGETPKRPAKFTLDRMGEMTALDPKCKRDTVNPEYERRLKGFKTAHVLLSNQTYGHGKILEDPKSYGFARSSLLKDLIYDSGHLHV